MIYNKINWLIKINNNNRDKIDFNLTVNSNINIHNYHKKTIHYKVYLKVK